MKSKKIKILDAKHHKELINDEFEICNIIKPNTNQKKKMKTIKNSNPLKMPAWFLAWSSSYEARTNARFDKIEAEVKKLREDNDKRFQKIEDILKRNNLK